MHYSQLNAVYSDPLWDLNEVCWYWDLWKMNDDDFDLENIYILSLKLYMRNNVLLNILGLIN